MDPTIGHGDGIQPGGGHIGLVERAELAAAPARALAQRLLRAAPWDVVATVLLVLAAWLAPSLLQRIVVLQSPWSYLVPPLFWLLPGVAALSFGRTIVPGLRDAPVYVLLGLLLGVLHVVTLVGLGVFSGFGYSPYDHSWRGLLLNTWYVAIAAIGAELARWFIVHALAARWEGLAAALGTLLFGLTVLPYYRYPELTRFPAAFDDLGRFVLPSVMVSMLATFLALRGGPLASLAYVVLLQAFEWYSPILPDLSWQVAAFAGVAVPVVGVLFVDTVEADESSGEEPLVSNGTLVALLLLTFAVWFNAGVFGVRPSLVHGVSMEPAYHTGDLVVTEHVRPEEIEVGDVIRFQHGSRVVIHRVVEIRHEGNERVFITKGDNTDAPDSPVLEHELQGRVALHIPKAGIPAIVVKRLIGAVLG